ncbi:unnamed protein product [Phytomonas sp. EM1]|nr:unnamed protein product [Phytomonas sp. EM1]|eukprot:CCW63000.1 unnamed protein product [Phytomonas sp. isolate EM1]
MQILKIELLDAHLLCGLASTNCNEHRLFLGSRLDCKYVTGKTNRSLRHFIAQPRFLKLGIEAEKIITIAATSPNSIIALTELCSLYLIKIEFDFNGQELNWTISEKLVITEKIKCVPKEAEMIFSTNGESNTLVVYSQESSTLNTISFSTDYENLSGTVSQITVPHNFRLRRVEFVGSYYFVMTLEECSSHKPAFQFVSFFTSGEGTHEFVQHEVLPLKKVPVASYFNTETEEHVIVCVNMASWSPILEQDLNTDLLVQSKFTFLNGPYSSKAVTAAIWKPFHTARGTDQVLTSFEYAEDDINAIQSLIAPKDTNPASSLRLFYALLNSTVKGSSEVAVFCVDTLGYIHNRLVKQFHNATQGLQQLLSTRHPIKHPFLLSWNPRHLRRALRLLGQEQVDALFHDIAEVMRSSVSGSIFEASRYGEISTAGCSIAMHIITLSKQMGVVLDPKDTEILAALFRSSREISHECLAYLSRMKLILESCIQQRRINNLLYIGQGRITEIPENEEANSAQGAEFFPVSNYFHSNQALQTKYDMNSWADILQTHMSHHIQVAESAMQYITDAYDFNLTSKDKVLSDWQFLGREPNLDSTFNRFESTLMGTAFQEKRE